MSSLSAKLRATWGVISNRDRTLLVLTASALLAGSLWLLPFWRESPELSHAFVTPLLCLWLLKRSSEEPTLPLNTPWRGLLLATLGVVGMAILAVTALAALAQGIGHTQTAFVLAVSLATFCATVALALDRATPLQMRCNGASLAGAALWLFATPLPPGFFANLTRMLQEQISAGVLHTLLWLGIPVTRHGTILEFAYQSVGVEEACSGVRSLLACLYLGTFLGGILLRGWWPRLALLFYSGALALVANFLRSLTLCLLAHRRVDISGFWHDATAYALLGLSAVAIYGGCVWTARRLHTPAERKYAAISPSWAPFVPQFLGVCALCLAGLVFWRSLPSSANAQRLPDLNALLRLDQPGWGIRENPNVARFSTALNTPHLREVSYYRADTEVTFYFAFWPAGLSTLGSVGLHTPDMCLPGAGWHKRPSAKSSTDFPLANPTRHTFEQDGDVRYIWFWHYFGGQLVEELPNLYPWNLGRFLLRRPVSAQAAQWVVRISSNRPLDTLQHEPLLREFARRLEVAGLAGVPLR